MEKLIVFILFSIFLDRLGKKKKKTEQNKKISDSRSRKKEKIVNHKKTEKENVKRKKKEEQRLTGALNEIINALSPEDKEKVKKLMKSKGKSVEKEFISSKTEEPPKIDTNTFKDDVGSGFDYSPVNTHEEKEQLDVNFNQDYFGGDDLVRAIIMKEILDKPISVREEA